MSLIINSKGFLFHSIVILFLFSFAKLNTEIVNINSTCEKSYYQAQKFRINLGENIKNYLSVQVIGNGEYAIIYYKSDSSFKNRNQIAKGSSNTTMWFNQAQIREPFYLSVICANQNCSYNLSIESNDKLELRIGQIYTYYVTEELKSMEFSINAKIILDKEKSDGFLSLWAKGNKEMTSEFSEYTYNKYSKDGLYVYVIQVKNHDEIEMQLKVTAILGDLINVGVLLFNEQNICLTPIEELKSPISGYLYHNYINDLDKACFLFPENIKPNIISPLEEVPLFKLEKNSENQNENIYCLEINSNDLFSYRLYSFYYNNEAKLNDQITILPPLRLGEFYQLNMRKGEKIGLMPLISDTDFDCLTYKILQKNGEFNSYMINCVNYPFCNISNNKEYLIKYNAVSRTYLKKELPKVFSPINENQNIIIFECESDNCLINGIIYTDRNEIALEPLISYQNFLIKNSKEQIKLSSEYKNFLLNINLDESTTKIIESTSTYKIKYNNKTKTKYFYEVDNSYKSKPDIGLQINAKEKSIYSASVSNIEKNERNNVSEIFINPGMDYIIKIDYNQSNDNIIKIMNYYQDSIDEDSIYYINFYSDSCNFEVNREQSGENKYIHKNEKKFYYYFDKISNNNNGFKITNLENNKNCLVEVSVFKYKHSNDELNSIYLLKDKPKTFLFDQKNNQVKYRYLFADNDKNLKFIITPNKVSEIYIESLTINDVEIKRNIPLSHTNENQIIVEYIDKYCNKDFQPCKIEIILNVDDMKEIGIVETSIVHYNTENEKSKTNKIFVVLGICSAIIIIAIIVVIVILLIRNKKSYESIAQQVNTISYIEERDENDKEDLLLNKENKE